MPTAPREGLVAALVSRSHGVAVAEALPAATARAAQRDVACQRAIPATTREAGKRGRIPRTR